MSGIQVTPLRGGLGSTLSNAITGYIFGQLPQSLATRYTLDTLNRVSVSALSDIILPALRRQLEENNTDYTGELSRNLKLEIVNQSGDETHLKISSTDYLKLIEWGSTPRDISNEEREALPKWVTIRGFTGLNKGPEGFEVSEDKQDLAENIAALIEAAISDHGNKPHPFVAETIEENHQLIFNEIGKDFVTELGI